MQAEHRDDSDKLQYEAHVAINEVPIRQSTNELGVDVETNADRV